MRLNRKFILLLNWAAGVCLALMGFSSCADDKKNEAGVEYGTPSATYKFYGNVRNGDKKAVPDIKVEATRRTVGVEGELKYPAISNSTGEYSVDISGFPADYVDNGDERWNSGAAEKEVNVILKTK